MERNYYLYGDIPCTKEHLNELKAEYSKVLHLIVNPEFIRTSLYPYVRDDEKFLEDVIEQLETTGVYEG